MEEYDTERRELAPVDSVASTDDRLERKKPARYTVGTSLASPQQRHRTTTPSLDASELQQWRWSQHEDGDGCPSISLIGPFRAGGKGFEDCQGELFLRICSIFIPSHSLLATRVLAPSFLPAVLYVRHRPFAQFNSNLSMLIRTLTLYSSKICSQPRWMCSW